MSYGCTHTIQQTLLLLKNLSSTLLLLSSVTLSQGSETDSLDLDLDAMWNRVEWGDPSNFDVITEVYEVENITATAGVRGAEAEHEILQYLYYRRSMKDPR